MEEEVHTSQELTDHPKTDNDKQPKDFLEFLKRNSSRSSFGVDSVYPRRQKCDKALRKMDLQDRMLELKRQWKLLRADDNSNSNYSPLTEVASERRKKSKVVFGKSPIKPERFPGIYYNRWQLWVNHYNSVAKANGWSDQQTIAALPVCLTSWAAEELECVLRTNL